MKQLPKLFAVFSIVPLFLLTSCTSNQKSGTEKTDCAGRFISLGPLINEEIEGMRKVWNVPMAGMFSNAELARATGGNLEMHNLTACVVALKEK